MTEDTPHWLVPSAISTDLPDGTDEVLIDTLLQQLTKSGAVTDAARIKADVLEREKLASTAIEEDEFVPHALTAGVSSFCAAIGIVQKKKICILIAWPEHTPHNLKLFASLIDLLKTPKIKQALQGAENPAAVFSIMEQGLKKYGISC